MKPFSVRYISNKTHYKCDYNHTNWVDKLYPIAADNISPCIANTSLPVNVKFRAATNNL